MLFFPSFLTSTSNLLHLGNEVITDSGQFIIVSCLLLQGLLQQVDAHLLLPQAHLASVSLGLCLDLALALGHLFSCQLEFLFCMGFQRLLSLVFLFNSYYVILKTVILHWCIAFDHLFLSLKPLEEVRERLFYGIHVCNKLVFFLQNLLDFSLESSFCF